LTDLGSHVKSLLTGRIIPGIMGMICLMAVVQTDDSLFAAKTPSGTGLTNVVTVTYSNLAGTAYMRTAAATNVVSDYIQFNVTSATAYAVIGSTAALRFDIQSSNNFSDRFRVRILTNMVTSMTSVIYGDENYSGTLDSGDIRITNTQPVAEGGIYTAFLRVVIPPSTPLGLTNKVVVEVKSVRSNLMSNYVTRITNTIITFAPTNAVLSVSASDGQKVISDFGGAQYLNSSDVLVQITLDQVPKDANNVWLYYDVNHVPDGGFGPNTEDKAVKLVWNGMAWQGIIPAHDPMLQDGVTVQFVVSVDYVVYDNAGTPYKYQIRSRPDQGEGFNVFPTILDLRVDQQINILYEVKRKSRVRIDIYDLKGDLVRRYDEGTKAPGQYGPIFWDGKNHAGMTVAVGMYFVTIRAEGLNQVRKVIIIK
jgi:hypothetical protein